MIPAEKIRSLLDKLGLSQRGAARELQINERTMRKYCSEGAPVLVYYALMYLASKI